MAETKDTPPLLLDYTWTFADFAAGAKASAAGRKPFWRVWFTAGVSVMLLFLGAFALADSLRKGEPFTWRHQGLAAIVTLAALWFVAGRPYLKKRRLRRAFHRSGEDGSAFRWSVTESDVKIERLSPRAEMMDELVWTDVVRVTETPEGWLLHVDSQNYYWLPLRAVPPEQTAEFVHLARRGALRYGARTETFLG